MVCECLTGVGVLVAERAVSTAPPYHTPATTRTETNMREEGMTNAERRDVQRTDVHIPS